MKGFKKIFYIFIATLMLFTLSVTAFAGNETNDGNIKIQVATDKGSYGATGVAEITATITNVSGEDINNVTAQAVFNDLAPVGKRKSETSKSVDVLKSGESFSFTYKATLNKDEHKLNFFQKIILWFVRLFNGGYNASNNNIDVVTECVTEIEFGKFTAENVFQVGYEKTETDLTDEDFNYMEIVETTLSEIENSENWSELSIDKRKEKAEKIINDFVSEGYIVKDSVEYYEENNTFYFEYVCGWDYYFSLTFYEDHSLCTENIEEITFDENVFFNYSNTVSKSGLNRSVKTSSYSGRQVIIYGWDSVDYYKKNHEDNQAFLNEYKKFAIACDGVGIKSTVYTNSTVELYKNILKDNDLIVIAEHGVNYNNQNEVGFIIKEKATKKSKQNYANDKNENRIEIINGHYVIKPKFISHYYSNNDLEGAIVYIGSCQGFGRNGIVNYKFSDAFENYGGASCTLGFCETVKTLYQWRIMIEFIPALIYGETTKNALDIATNKWGIKDPNGAFPILTNYYSKLSNTGTLTGTILEETTETPINGVTITATKDRLTKTTITDEYGVFKLELPVGDWKITFSSDTHTYDEYAAVKIEKDVDTVLQYPIYMTPKKGRVVFYSVKDSVTSEIINGVTIDIINTKTNKVVATRTTSDIGSPVCVLPYGTYDIVFQHDSYEPYRETIVIGYGEIPIKNIKLQPKVGNSTGTVMGTVTDNTYMYSPPICGVKVSAIDNNGKVAATTTTDENGRYTLKLPYGSYSILFECNNYESYEMQLTVSSNSYTRNIELKPKDDDRNIIASGECGHDTSNIIWTLYNDGSLVISGSGNMVDYDYPSDVPWYSNREYITDVTIENGILDIGKFAFADCINITSVDIPSSVLWIGDSAFLNCTKLSKLELPNSINSIYDYAFDNCTRLTSVEIPDSVVWIDRWAFKNCTGIVSIKMSDNTRAIGEGAFSGCENLKSINIPNQITVIDSYTFNLCKSLESIEIPDSVTSIGVAAFSFCESLKSIKIPDSITNIGHSAFQYCTSFETIRIPNGVTTISSHTFNSCRNLKSIEMPNTITTIEKGAFVRCASLTAVKIPNSVNTIGEHSFSECENLTLVEIPNSVTNIEAYAFGFCKKIKNVYYKGTEEEWNSISIGSNNAYLSNAIIHYNT